jgi:hypothetical protein
MPLAGAGHGVECDDTVREQIRAFPKAAVEVIGGRTRGGKYPAALLVDRQPAPGIGAAVGLPFHPLPRLVTDLTFRGNRVENPFHLAGDSVVRANVSG